ncbi:hypothetical protein V8C42DRAFT_311825 [Trichoderma barbatum]
MSRGDDFPRYTYMMDFNPMDEDTPLRDYWQTADDLDNEDAATIASLATQALQSKSGYEYGEGIEVNEPNVVVNYMYSESRSSPQSQYSTTIQTEPAESFRGLMEDHDRGAQISEENAASEYDFEPETREHVSSDVAGIEDSAELSGEQYAPESFRSMLSVAAEVEVADQNSPTHEVEMSAAMTASRVVNGVLSRSYATTTTEAEVNLQALQSQAPQPTPPLSESRPVSIETPDHAEEEIELAMEVDERHADGEPEIVLPVEEDQSGEREKNQRDEDEGDDDAGDEVKGRKKDKEDDEDEETTSDTGAQQQLMMEFNERSTVADDEGLPLLLQTPRKRGRPRKSDAAVPPLDLPTERLGTAQLAVHKETSHAGNGAVESATTDGADLSRAEELPAERKRGRPRKSEIPEPAAATTIPTAPTPGKRGPGRPPKTTAPDSTLEATPTTGKRGRPRKSSVADAARPSATVLEPLVAGTAVTAAPGSCKRGRPRKSDAMDATQASSNEAQLPAAGVVAGTEAPPSGKRGRPRKSDVLDAAQSSTNETHEVVVTAAPVPNKRGRPRKSDTTGATQASTEEPELPAVEAAETRVPSGKRGRPRKSDVTGTTQAPTEGLQLTAVEAPVTAISAPGKRGRPRKSDVMDATPTQVPTHEAQLPVVEASITTTPASGKRGRPLKASITTSMTTPGKRGRPSKSTIPSVQPGTEVLPIGDEDANKTVASPVVKSTGQRGRPPRRADVLEGRAVSPSPLSTKKRGRGRPPKSETMLYADLPSTAVAPDLGTDAQEAEAQEPSKPTDDVPKDLAAGETTYIQRRGGVEATPARKRGRPKTAVVDESLSVMDMLVTGSAKKRGRPLNTIDTIDSAEEHGRPLQSEIQEEEEEPTVKRRRANNDTTMEDAVDEEESQRKILEDEMPSVEALRKAPAADDTTHKRPDMATAKAPSFISTEERTTVESSIRLDRRPRISGEMLDESSSTKPAERTLIAPPKSLFDMLSNGKKLVRQKTYGKRSKR